MTPRRTGPDGSATVAGATSRSGVRVFLVRAGLVAVSGISASAVHADPVYVIEQLVVSVGSQPGGEGERVGSVKSGDELDLIERVNDEAHVRLPNGTEGWLKASYVSAEQPLAHRLAERTAEVDKLKQDLTRLQADLATAKAANVKRPGGVPNSTAAPADQSSSSADGPSPAATNAAVTAHATTSAGAGGKPTIHSTPKAAPGSTSGAAEETDSSASSTQAGSSAALSAHDASVFLRSPDEPIRPLWEWLLGTSVVMLIIGFGAGWRTLDRRIRSKYGGLRIY